MWLLSTSAYLRWFSPRTSYRTKHKFRKQFVYSRLPISTLRVIVTRLQAIRGRQTICSGIKTLNRFRATRSTGRFSLRPYTIPNSITLLPSNSTYSNSAIKNATLASDYRTSLNRRVIPITLTKLLTIVD